MIKYVPVVDCVVWIVKVTALLVPFTVVTVTLRAPSVVGEAIVKVAVSVVVLPTFGALIVTPVPLIVTMVAPTTKFVPVRVTGTAVPTAPVFGDIVDKVGVVPVDVVWIVKVTALLVPTSVRL